MSTFWTPNGEHKVNDQAPDEMPKANAPQGDQAGMGGEMTPEQEAEARQQMDMLRQQLSQVPAEVVVANHAFGLFELAAIHLSSSPANLEGARLAIDAMQALVGGMTGRLGEAEPQLRDALNNLQLGYVQISQAADGEAGASAAQGDQQGKGSQN